MTDPRLPISKAGIPRLVEPSKPVDPPKKQESQPRGPRSKAAGLLRVLGIGTLAITAAFAGHTQSHAGDARRRQEFLGRLMAAALERTRHQVTYDPGYVALAYPGGDVPADSGVCSDEMIRIYRAVGIDLQKEVHEDITKNFAAYPMSRWRQAHPDPNIDHRRVANLMVFLSRKGEDLPVTSLVGDYQPGDMVAWDLGNGAIHIGMVVDQKAPLTGRFMIVHNIGAGPKVEDVLFDWKIIGHYRYFGSAGMRSAPTRRSPFVIGD